MRPEIRDRNDPLIHTRHFPCPYLVLPLHYSNLYFTYLLYPILPSITSHLSSPRFAPPRDTHNTYMRRAYSQCERARRARVTRTTRALQSHARRARVGSYGQSDSKRTYIVRYEQNTNSARCAPTYSHYDPNSCSYINCHKIRPPTPIPPTSDCRCSTCKGKVNGGQSGEHQLAATPS